MNALERLRELKVKSGDTKVRVLFVDGQKLTGYVTDHTDEIDNEEGIASIDLQIGKEFYCLFENEIASIELA